MIDDLWLHGYQYFLKGSYEAALKCFDAKSKENPSDCFALHNKGWSLVKLRRYEEASECFVELERDVLSTLLSLANHDIDEGIEEKKQLSLFLGKMLSDNKFFQITTKDVTENIEAYKKIYIKSMLIISLLHIDSDEEKNVAHYATEKTAEFLLIDDSPLRLSLITKSNDPNEGQSLLYYFYKEKGLLTEEKEEFGAFATSFTFNPDHLNQFRLYGKNSDGVETGGISLVVKQHFFNNYKPDNSAIQQSVEEKLSKKIGINYDKSNKRFQDAINNDYSKLPLFRCIYLDPDTGFVSSIGQREEYTFYQNEEEENKLDGYQQKINSILKEVKNQLKELKKDVENLDPKIVSRLLLLLRYLTKNVAFREEQECRIITVKPREKAKICPYSNKMYFDYLKMNENDYVEKVILGANCFKEQPQIKKDFSDKCLKITDKICPDKKKMFVDEIDNLFTYNNDAEAKFRNELKDKGIKNIENSGWSFNQ